MSSAEHVLDQVREWHQAWGDTNSEDLDPLDLWERLNDILNVQQPESAEASFPASAGSKYCDVCDGLGVVGAVAQGLAQLPCATCAGTGRRGC